MHCRMCRRISGLCPPPSPVGTMKNVSRHCQMSSVAQRLPDNNAEYPLKIEFQITKNYVLKTFIETHPKYCIEQSYTKKNVYLKFKFN